MVVLLELEWQLTLTMSVSMKRMPTGLCKKTIYFLFCLCATLSKLEAEHLGYAEPWGKDKELCAHKQKELPPPRTDTPSRVAEVIIAFRQEVLSKADGPRSNFRPSSSEYMKLAIRKHGFIKGYLMGCDRLLRENKEPWVYRTTTLWDMEFKYDEP